MRLESERVAILNGLVIEVVDVKVMSEDKPEGDEGTNRAHVGEEMK